MEWKGATEAGNGPLLPHFIAAFISSRDLMKNLAIIYFVDRAESLFSSTLFFLAKSSFHL